MALWVLLRTVNSLYFDSLVTALATLSGGYIVGKPNGAVISKLTMQISGSQLTELTEVIEDTIEYFCDKETVSGELAWTVISCLAEAKIAEMKGEVTAV